MSKWILTLLGVLCLISRQVDGQSNAQLIFSSGDRHVVTSIIHRIINNANKNVNTKIMPKPNVRTPKIYPVNNSTDVEPEEVEPLDEQPLNATWFQDLPENVRQKAEEIPWELVNFFEHPVFLASLGFFGLLLPFLLVLTVCLPIHQRCLKRSDPEIKRVFVV